MCSAESTRLSLLSGLKREFDTKQNKMGFVSLYF